MTAKIVGHSGPRVDIKQHALRENSPQGKLFICHEDCDLYRCCKYRHGLAPGPDCPGPAPDSYHYELRLVLIRDEEEKPD